MAARALAVLQQRVISINDVVGIYKHVDSEGSEPVPLGDYVVHECSTFLDIHNQTIINLLNQGRGVSRFGSYLLKLKHPF
jgi:hypothetical protein